MRRRYFDQQMHQLSPHAGHTLLIDLVVKRISRNLQRFKHPATGGTVAVSVGVAGWLGGWVGVFASCF